MRSPAFRRAVAATLLATLITACGGGGTATVAGGTVAGGANLQIALRIPHVSSAMTAQSTRRAPKYVSPATKSVAIAVNGGTATNYNVSAGSPGCQTDTAHPAFVEFPVNLEPRGITVGSDGALWFVEDAGNAVGRYQIGGAYADTFTGVDQNSIVSGADGALWIADVFSTTIGHLTTGGVYTQFTGLPSDVQLMAVAGDGSVWYIPFTSAPLNVVYHVSSTGAYIPADTVTTQGTTHWIATGPDGAIWFTESNGTNAWIGRIALVSGTWTLTNELSMTAALGAGTVPLSLIAGPDGALWFTDSANMMDRMTVAGNVTNRYPITAGGGYIAVGADGALWFTEYGAPTAGKIGRITMAGALSESSPPSGYPQGIAAGGDGNIYFTENSYAPYTIHNLGILSYPTVCSLTAGVPAGTANVTVTAYDAPGGAAGSGNALSTQTLPVTVVANTTSTLGIVLNGVVNRVTLGVAGRNPPLCSGTCSVPILLDATDADGNVIVGPGSYVDANGDPLTITLGVTGTGTFSPGSFTSPPTTPPALTYSGCFTGATIAPSVSGGTVPGGTVPLVMPNDCG